MPRIPDTIHKFYKQNKPYRSPNAKQLDYRWSKLSKLHRSKNPLCVKCMEEGKITGVAEVDHIVPRDVAPERMYDPTNLQSLCKRHHGLKTRAEQLNKLKTNEADPRGGEL